jgi:hypothetical protein
MRSRQPRETKGKGGHEYAIRHRIVASDAVVPAQ